MDRIYEQIIEEHFQQNRQMLFLMGPRQVGKTTLAKMLSRRSKRFYYFNWDNLDDRELMVRGPKAIRETIGFAVTDEPPLVVFDEIHKFRDWKTLIKGFFDTYAHEGELRVIVTGSARLEMFNAGGDSLMGRYLRYRIHPLSIGELLRKTPPQSEISPPQHIEDPLFDALVRFGGFPEPFLKQDVRFAEQWKVLRHQQLFEGEVKELTHIHEIKQMELLTTHLQQQIGSTVNYSNLARKIRVSGETVRRWLNALSGLYFCFPLHPWSKNIPRSLLKEPKYYLWDWSLIEERGGRAENFVASHLYKAVHFWTDSGWGNFALFYLRNKEGKEVDFIVTKNGDPWFLVEVKAAANGKITPALRYYHRVTQAPHAFQIAFDAPYEKIDCFRYSEPVIIPARSLLSQLI